ncbi:MAG: hypothetical protein QXD41_02625 [Nitrososphaeria archaeon]
MLCIFAKLIGSNWFLQNPYLNDWLIEKRINKVKIKGSTEQYCMVRNAIFYEQATANNLQNNKSNINVGDNTHIRGKLLIFPYRGKITVGSSCYREENAFIWSTASVRIGNGVLISHNCNIIDTHSHEFDYREKVESSYKGMLREGHPRQVPNIESSSITIGDYAWLSFNVSVLKGVTIEEGRLLQPSQLLQRMWILFAWLQVTLLS